MQKPMEKQPSWKGRLQFKIMKAPPGQPFPADPAPMLGTCLQALVCMEVPSGSYTSAGAEASQKRSQSLQPADL